MAAIEGGVFENIAVKEGAWIGAGRPIATLRLAANAKNSENTPAVIERNLAAELAAQQALTTLMVEQSEQR